MSSSGTRRVAGIRRAPRMPLPVELKKPERQLTQREKVQVKRMIGENIELKFVNAFLTSAASTTTPIITGCTDVAQGDGDSDRTGDRTKLVGTLELRARMQANVDTGDVGQTIAYIRMILFQFHPTSDSQNVSPPRPTAANILLNGPSGAPDILSFYNHDRRQDYAILYDEVHKLTGIAVGGAGAVSSNSGMCQYISRKIPLAKKVRAQMQYQAASQVVATNHIYMMTMSNLASDLQNPTLIWSVKTFFRDG